ncbi:hypothetical protein SEA_ZOOMAN_244 [Microbacterium phage Zooman]|nr:hypothetical protein SEA_ZOOMAN_244 [Microbacterium phage Zooman]
MGVYQSKTEPKVRVKTVKHVASLDLFKWVKKADIVRELQREYNIPTRVKPTIHHHYPLPYQMELRFEWFEVETD